MIAHPSFPPLLYGNATIRFCDDGGGTTGPRLLSLSDVIFATLPSYKSSVALSSALKKTCKKKIGVFVFKMLVFLFFKIYF